MSPDEIAGTLNAPLQCSITFTQLLHLGLPCCRVTAQVLSGYSQATLLLLQIELSMQQLVISLTTVRLNVQTPVFWFLGFNCFCLFCFFAVLGVAYMAS